MFLKTKWLSISQLDQLFLSVYAKYNFVKDTEMGHILSRLVSASLTAATMK